jgi:hypothetical protein
VGIQVQLDYGAWISQFALFNGTVPVATFNGDIAGTTLTIDSLISGALAPGNVISDVVGLVTPGTYIISGTGPYTVNYSQTVAVEPMTALQPPFVTPAKLMGYWTAAQQYQRNDGGGPVDDPNQQSYLLNLIMAHLAALDPSNPANGTNANMVGRIVSGTQGPATIATQMDLPPGSAQWWNQTQFGAEYWVLTSPYRRMRYIPGPRRNFGTPWSRYGSGYGRFGGGV